MPTNPTAPNSSASVDRLSLVHESVRGAQPSTTHLYASPFEAETSGLYQTGPGQCFDAGASSLLCGVGHCACFEMEN